MRQFRAEKTHNFINMIGNTFPPFLNFSAQLFLRPNFILWPYFVSRECVWRACLFSISYDLESRYFQLKNILNRWYGEWYINRCRREVPNNIQPRSRKVWRALIGRSSVVAEKGIQAGNRRWIHQQFEEFGEWKQTTNPITSERWVFQIIITGTYKVPSCIFILGVLASQTAQLSHICIRLSSKSSTTSPFVRITILVPPWIILLSCCPRVNKHPDRSHGKFTLLAMSLIISPNSLSPDE